MNMIPQSNHFTSRTIIRIMYGVKVVQQTPEIEIPIQDQRINDLVKPKTGGLQALKDANPDIDFDRDWNMPQFEQERDHSSWLNRYDQEREQEPPAEYPFHNFNYGP